MVEVLGGELCGQHVVIGMTATPGPHPVQDRFAIGGEVERLWYDARGFQQPAVVVTHPTRPEGEVEDDIVPRGDEVQQSSPQTSLDLTANIRW